MAKPNVSVIIPTYNNLKLLKRYLPGVLAMMRSGDELIISDDASTDQTVPYLVSRFDLRQGATKKSLSPQVRLYRTKLTQPKPISFTLIVQQQNQRFARNVNQAVKLAQHDLIFLLNSDVRPEKSVLDVLVPHFQTKKNLFAIACLEYEGQNQRAPKAGKNRLWYEFGLFWHSKARDFEPGETAWASGGSAMFDKRKWLELGGFDERFYPAYWEDVDLSFRAKKRGWLVWFEPKAVVYHQHETTNQDVFQLDQMKKISWRHADYFTRKNGDFWQKLAYFIWRPYWWVKRSKEKIDYN